MQSHVVWGTVEQPSKDSESSGNTKNADDAARNMGFSAPNLGQVQDKVGWRQVEWRSWSDSEPKSLPVSSDVEATTSLPSVAESRQRAGPSAASAASAAESGAARGGAELPAGAASCRGAPSGAPSGAPPSGGPARGEGEAAAGRAEAQDEGLVELAAAAEIWSRGSEQHRSGNCRPCHYAHTKSGCRSGSECNFCHIPHTTVKQTRVCATRRRQCQRVASFLQQAHLEGRPGLQEAVKSFTSRSQFLHGILVDDLKKQPEQNDVGPATQARSVAAQGAAAVAMGAPRRSIMSL